MKSTSSRLPTLFCWLALGVGSMGVAAQDTRTEQPAGRADTPGLHTAMTNERLRVLIERLDPEAQSESGYWQLRVAGRDVTVITDDNADRMRVLTSVARAEDLTREQLYRLMQANFDTALDARYCIAKSIVWSTYLHPLSPLTDEQFLLGLGQVINLANTYGSSFSSGALIFGGGDSSQQQRELLRDLMEKGLEI